MAISNIRTLLPLEEYARIMAIPGWHFNQVTHPGRGAAGGCDVVWYQESYWNGSDKIIGRNDLAQAIVTAERKIADACGFWPAPVWVQGEEHEWIHPARGVRQTYPRFKTNWGYLISAGVERWDLVGLYESPVVYSDRDGDGLLDWATVTATLGYPYYLYLTSPTTCNLCELVVVPHGQDPTVREWRIRPLTVTHLGGYQYRIEGPRWMFVRPEEHLTTLEIPLDEDEAFLNAVDVYCHYNYTGNQAAYIWRDSCCNEVGEDSQSAKVTVVRSRTGHFYARTADYDSSDGTWSLASWPCCEEPDILRIWYYAGYRDGLSGPCDWMGASLKNAIVSLTNCYLVDNPCGCDYTVARFARDREEQEVNMVDIAMAQTLFGTTMRGAVTAYSMIKTLPPLGKGG